MSVAEKDKVVGSGGSSKTNKNLSKFQKLKNSSNANVKTTPFLTSKASTTFIKLRQTFIKASIL